VLQHPPTGASGGVAHVNLCGNDYPSESRRLTRLQTKLRPFQHDARDLE